MKKLVINIFLIALLLTVCATPTVRNVASADELVFNTEAFLNDIDVLQHAYILERDIDFTDNYELEWLDGDGITYNESAYSSYPVVSDSSTISIDLCGYDMVYIEYAPVYISDYTDDWVSGTEDSYPAPYLFKNDSSIPTLILTLDFLPDVGPYGVKRIATYRKLDNLELQLEDFYSEAAVYFSNLDVSTIGKYNGMVTFCESDVSPALKTVYYNAGYMQGVVHAAIDYALNTNVNNESTLPDFSGHWSETNQSRFHTGFGDSYDNVKNMLNSGENPFSSYYSSGGGGNIDGTPPLVVTIFDYDLNQIGSINITAGDTISLAQIEQACGELIDERWLYVTTDFDGNEVFENWNFFNPVNSSLELVPRGCNIKVYDVDFSTILGERKVEYGATITASELKEACAGLQADEFSSFLHYTNIMGEEITDIIGDFEFDSEITKDYDLIKRQYTVTVTDNATGETLTTFNVDAGVKMTKDDIYNALGTTMYDVNDASYWGDAFELNNEVRADVLVTVTAAASGTTPDNDSDNSSENESGNTSIGNGNSTGPGFGVGITPLLGILLVIIIGVCFSSVSRDKKGGKK